jgi:cell wall-associated NlpC family hydrolase
MKKIYGMLGCCLFVIVMALVLAGTVAAGALVGGGSQLTDLASQGGSPLLRIPLPMLVVYQQAAGACAGLSWTVLAAIGTIESDNGQSDLPGVHAGHNPAGAAGPMQFEPATFSRYARPVPAGGSDPPTPYDPVDAAYAAARLLCANGAATAPGVRHALFVYNHSEAYATQVLQLSAALASGGLASGGLASGAGTPVDGSSSSAQVALRFALAQVGTPYRWGAESLGVGFDCSGLVQAAWAAAGVRLPRVAQDQFDAWPLLPPGAPLRPGDLVFFGPPGGGVTHVGLVVDSSGLMVDAPHAGAVVRVEPFPLIVGSSWGGDVYEGATRPGA